MTPEQRARQQIDRTLDQAGWLVQSHRDMNITAGLGVAVREFPLKSHGFADYMLYADGKAIGIIEAKKEDHTLTGVETQSAKYTAGFPDHLPRWALPLPFAYESTGTVTQFTNVLDPDPRSREVFSFHRPEELIRLAKLGPTEQLRARLRNMPPLDTSKLWDKQVTAVTNLETSLADNRPRSLIQMVMGAGKTFTACNIAYRLIKFGAAKRTVVDRNVFGPTTGWSETEKRRRRAMRQLRRSKFRLELENLIVRYAVALDHANLDVALLQMWGVLERLTDTVGARYDETIRRAVWIFRDRSIAKEKLEGIRLRRNLFVHAARSAEERDQLVYSIKQFVDAHLITLIRNNLAVSSLEEYGTYLALPATLDALETQRKQRVRAIRFQKPPKK